LNSTTPPPPHLMINPCNLLPTTVCSVTLCSLWFSKYRHYGV
jgi:hypothetical protein